MADGFNTALKILDGLIKESKQTNKEWKTSLSSINKYCAKNNYVPAGIDKFWYKVTFVLFCTGNEMASKLYFDEHFSSEEVQKSYRNVETVYEAIIDILHINNHEDTEKNYMNVVNQLRKMRDKIKR